LGSNLHSSDYRETAAVCRRYPLLNEEHVMDTAQPAAASCRRTGESGAVPMRTDRFFAVNAAWYFTTREGASIGPFASKTDAQGGLADFVKFIAIAQPRVLSSLYASLHTD
jgi:hypothetical protein